MNSKIAKYVLAAVVAAMVFVGTLVVQIAIPATGGYINIGDAIIIIGAWLIGGAYGGVAAAVGAGLVDIMSYPVYAPGTIIIKFLMAIAAYLVIRAFRNTRFNYVGIVLGAIVSEVIMVLGYLFYEAVILGLGKAAIVGIGGNLIQGVASIVIATVAITIMQKTKVTRLLENNR